MYERMLEKQNKPTIEAMKAYCGEASSLFTILHSWLMQYSDITYDIVFPFGNHYGWGIAFRKKNKLICNIFPEKDAFTVMIRLTNQQFESIYDKVESYTQAYIDQKYACGDGGWIHYRVLSEVHVEDIKKLVKSKCHI